MRKLEPLLLGGALGTSAAEPLSDEPQDEQRLEQQRDDTDDHLLAVGVPEARPPVLHDGVIGNEAVVDAPATDLPPVEEQRGRLRRRHAQRRGIRAFQERIDEPARLAARRAERPGVTTHDARAEHRVVGHVDRCRGRTEHAAQGLERIEGPAVAVHEVAGREHHRFLAQCSEAPEHLSVRQSGEEFDRDPAADAGDVGAQALLPFAVMARRLTGDDHEPRRAGMQAQRERQRARHVRVDGVAEHVGRQRRQRRHGCDHDAFVHHGHPREESLAVVQQEAQRLEAASDDDVGGTASVLAAQQLHHEVRVRCAAKPQLVKEFLVEPDTFRLDVRETFAQALVGLEDPGHHTAVAVQHEDVFLLRGRSRNRHDGTEQDQNQQLAHGGLSYGPGHGATQQQARQGDALLGQFVRRPCRSGVAHDHGS